MVEVVVYIRRINEAEIIQKYLKKNINALN